MNLDNLTRAVAALGVTMERITSALDGAIRRFNELSRHPVWRRYHQDSELHYRRANRAYARSRRNHQGPRRNKHGRNGCTKGARL